MRPRELALPSGTEAAWALRRRPVPDSPGETVIDYFSYCFAHEYTYRGVHLDKLFCFAKQRQANDR